MELLVANVNPAPAIDRPTGGPYELAVLFSKGAKGAIVLAIYVAHGNANPSGHDIQRTVHHIKPVVPADGGIHGVIESPALHGCHAQGHDIFQEFGPCSGFDGGHYSPCIVR